MVSLNRREAIEFLGIPEKQFDNFFRNAGEFNPLPREGGRGRFYFDQGDLARWHADYRWRCVTLCMEDYRLCLDFALAMHFRGYVLSDWGTGRQREFGQKVTNWVKGQLAEVAVKKFFEREFSLKVELDFELRERIVPQDIIGVVEAGGAIRDPRIKVGVKSSKPKSAYLVLGPNEVELEDRRSDIYVFCRPDLPDDHMLRISRKQILREVESQQHFPRYRNEIKELELPPCEIAGFCRRSELDQVTSIPGQDFDGVRYVKQTGRLRRSREEWRDLVERI